MKLFKSIDLSLEITLKHCGLFILTITIHVSGLTVIGFAGNDDKIKWLTEELKFDHAFNYKTCNVRKSLKEVAPKGIDCYYDNVSILLS